MKTSLLVAVAALSLAPTVPAQQWGARHLPVNRSTARPIRQVPAHQPFAPSTDLPAKRPNHPPLDTIPPFQFPDPGGAPLDANMDRSMVFHDAVTGQTFRLPEGPAAPAGVEFRSLEEPYMGVGPTPGGGEFPESFGTMTEATGHDSFPTSANVKLIAQFTDVTGEVFWSAGSGAMADSGVVLTAAHCVFAHEWTNPSGVTVPVNSWANVIHVYPAWDGNGQLGNPSGTIDNWGWATGTQYLAGSGFIASQDFGRDIGLVRIERGTSRMVGMLTGWYGWAFGGTCSDALSRVHNNFSYPAELCSSTLFDGTTLYAWYGQFDSCDNSDRELRIDGDGTCLGSVWGGMSGSNAYFVDTTGRYVEGICSHGVNLGWYYGDYTRLWANMVADMQQFEANTRGMSEDWEPLMLRAQGTTTVAAGSAMDDDLTVSLVNATNADPGMQTFDVRLYLSTNDNITTADTLLDTLTYSGDFSAMSEITLVISPPTIPSNTPQGTYYLGVIIDSSLPGTTLNDDTDTWDAQRIEVGPPIPPNDNCFGAIDLVEGFPQGFDLTWASPGPNPPCAQNGPGLWYTFTPSSTGPYKVSTCGWTGADTVLQVFTGSCLTWSSLGCNNSSSACGEAAELTWQATAGTTYLVHLSEENGQDGNGWLIAEPVTALNDLCTGAETVLVSTTHAFDTSLAHAESAAPCGQGEARDLWYVFTAPVSTTYSANTCIASYDSGLAVYSGDCPSLTLLDCDTNACSLKSEVYFDAVAGQTYLLRVFGWDGEVGTGELRIDPVSNLSLFCTPSAPTSEGYSVTLSLSVSMGPGMLHLEAFGGPPNEFGMFIVAANDSSGVAVSDGFLCLSGPLGRYSPSAGGAQNSLGKFDALRRFQSLSGNSWVGSGFDVPPLLPSPPGGTILPGSTWHFQLWLRDGANSNFSDGLSATF